MAFINPAIVEGAAILVRQAVSTAVSTDTPAVTPSPTSPTTSFSTPSATNTSPTSSSTDVANGGGPSGNQPNSSQSSPLLFFVALGFGVVFTNLWIIVGVKYCFRYNARNRQMRVTEDGEPITLENMPRPHRRRREKKLMTMDEVNEKFPMLKYKNWVAGRAREGLPTRGGVSAPPSRANSVRSVEGVVPELPPKERDSTDDRPNTSATSQQEKPTPGHQSKESTVDSVLDSTQATSQSPTEAQSSANTSVEVSLPKVTSRASDEHYHTDDDDDEHINAALPPECLAVAGDTCAICIDSLEDDDDVRGLTCGHAFHAVCLDPWLTSRRACCPLCKADYYTPKPRPAAAEGGDGTPGVIAVSLPDGRHRMNMPSRPPHSWLGMRGNGRGFPVRFIVGGNDNVRDQPAVQSNSNGRRRGLFGQTSPTSTPTATSNVGTTPTAPASETRNGWFSNLRSGLPRLGRQNNGSQNQAGRPVASGANAAVTPAQLEAGVQTETR